MTRGERRRRTFRIIARRWNEAVAWRTVAYNSKREQVEWPGCRGYGRSKSHFDCGVSRCGVCHGHKYETKSCRERIERMAAKRDA